MGEKITGVVFSDLGHGSHFMSLDWVQEALCEGCGFYPYPATLNLRLEAEELPTWRELKRRAPAISIATPDASFCEARCFLVEIENKIRGAVILPGVDGYPEDKIEVIAPVRLKDEMNLKDGDRVTVEFKDCFEACEG